MKLNLSLRVKVTFINTIVLIICSLVLTIGNSILALNTIDSVSKHSMSNVIPSTENSIAKELDSQNSNIDSSQQTIAQAKEITEAIKVEKGKLTTTSIIYMITVIGLGCLVTYLTTGKSLESIKKLNNEIKDISEHNLSKKIKEEGPQDEIKDLTKSFNHMLSRIEDAFESQKQFSSNVAHELRTPLAVIKMKIDVFRKRKESTNEDYEKLIEVVEKNNNRLSKIVEELLSISNKDNVELNDKINFNKLIKSIIGELKEVALEKNITINIGEKIEDSISKDFYGNEQLLYRAIYNLIENSIKYNKESGYVKINLKEENNYISVAIEDSGIGIKEEDYENIFEPFYRVDKSRSRKIGGSGLGLSIVKTIIKHHKGSIEVKSDSNGSKFTIKMPKSNFS